MSKWKVVRGYLTMLEMWHWEVLDNEGHFWGGYSTHAAALREADRAARTVEVTLPRVGRQRQIPVPDDYRNESPISVSDHGTFIGARFTSQGLTQDVAIHPEEAEPLGLTLLALARRKEQA